MEIQERAYPSIGSFFFMGLIGIVLASVVNIFLQSQALYLDFINLFL